MLRIYKISCKLFSLSWFQIYQIKKFSWNLSPRFGDNHLVENIKGFLNLHKGLNDLSYGLWQDKMVWYLGPYMEWEMHSALWVRPRFESISSKLKISLVMPPQYITSRGIDIRVERLRDFTVVPRRYLIMETMLRRV